MWLEPNISKEVLQAANNPNYWKNCNRKYRRVA
jgi:hypothetical protein